MATAIPLVSVQSLPDEKAVCENPVKLPCVFESSLRPDLVRLVHTLIEKNKRQAYGVSSNSGYQPSAASWGTGRAVSRIPRVKGSGTHRTSQGAFGNMCRSGGMFSPNKTWRRWHRRVNKPMKRHAIACAIASTGQTALVMARGHKIDEVPELPLVVSDKAEQISKTREACKLLAVLGCDSDSKKCKQSKAIKAGRGKSRNRRYHLKRGPLIIYNGKKPPLVKAFRNLPGVELCHVERLNILKLAPGGTLGRLCIWSKSAFQRLQTLYGSIHASGQTSDKHNYHLMRPIMSNPDLSRLINSDELQTSLIPKRKPTQKRKPPLNPLKNPAAMQTLNPLYPLLKKTATAQQTPGTDEYKQIQQRKIQNKKNKLIFKKLQKKIIHNK